MPLASPTGWPVHGARQARLVEGVAGLVQDAHQRGGDVVLAVAGGDADVGRRAAAERMGALVEPAALEVEPGTGHELAGEHLLPVGREGARGPDRVRLGTLAGQDGVDQGRQLGCQLLEERDDDGIAQVWLVGVEQGVVGAEAERGPGQRTGLAGEADHLLELRGEHGEVGLRAGLAPGHLAGGGGTRQRLDQGRLQRVGMAVLAAHLAQVRLLPGVEVRLVVGAGQVIAGLGMGEEVVGQALQGGQLLAAGGCGQLRHHHRRVPVQDGERTLDVADAAEPLLKRRVMPAHASSLRWWVPHADPQAAAPAT